MPTARMKSHGGGDDRPALKQALLVAPLCLSIALSGWCSPAAAEETAFRAGDKAPALTFKDCSGKSHSIDWSAGKPKAAVLFFFDPQSPPCLLEMNFLDTLLSRARDFGLAVFAIESRGRVPGDVTQSLERYCAIYRDPSFAMVPDPSFRLGSLFKVRQAPTTFLVDGSGAIVLLRESFEKATAVELTRGIERLLEQKVGFFSFALRGLGVSEEGEAALMAQLAARDDEGERAAPKALMAGDRVPALEFVDIAGRGTRWEWPATGTPARVVLLWGGLSVPDAEALAFLERIYAAAHDAGLDVLAVEDSGLDIPNVQELMDRYRRFHPPLSYPVVADPDARFDKLFGGGDRTPRTYLVGADGVIVRATAGFSEAQAAALTEDVERLLRKAGKNFPTLGNAVGTSLAPAAPSTPDEAPSIRQKRDREDAISANLRQGDYAFFNGNWGKALPYYLRVIEIDPKQVSVLVRVAQIHEQLGDPAKARETWERVLTLQADNAEARRQLEKLGR
jgi:peroxiredoxin